MIKVGEAGSIAAKHRAEESPVAFARATEGQVLLVAQESETALLEPAMAGVIPLQVQVLEFLRVYWDVFSYLLRISVEGGRSLKILTQRFDL